MIEVFSMYVTCPYKRVRLFSGHRVFVLCLCIDVTPLLTCEDYGKVPIVVIIFADL